MDFRALRSTISLTASRPWLATEFGSAGPTGSPSASHNAPYATSARAVFNCPHQSLRTRSFALRALLTAGGEPERKKARRVLRWKYNDRDRLGKDVFAVCGADSSGRVLMRGN